MASLKPSGRFGGQAERTPNEVDEGRGKGVEMSVMTTALDSVAVPVVRRPLRALRPTAFAPAPATPTPAPVALAVVPVAPTPAPVAPAVVPVAPAVAPALSAAVAPTLVIEPATRVTDTTVERVVTPQWQLVAPSVAERALGVLAHLSGAFASAAGPLLVARLAGQRSDYVREQATAAANFQLAFLAILAPFVLIGFLAVGLAALFLVPLVLAWLLTTVLAATAAADGERYRYPVLLRIVR